MRSWWNAQPLSRLRCAFRAVVRPLIPARARLPIGDVWGIGRQWARFLEGHGTATAAALSQQPDSWIRRHLNVIGLRTATELRGTPCIPLELAPPPKKGLVVSRMFGKKLTAYELVKGALIAYVTRAGEKLRRDRPGRES